METVHFEGRHIGRTASSSKYFVYRHSDFCKCEKENFTTLTPSLIKCKTKHKTYCSDESCL